MSADLSQSGGRVRHVETSYHGPGIHICGIQPKPSEERVSLKENYHPGFGYVSLLKKTKSGRKWRTVWSTVHPEECRTLGWIERKLVDDQEAEWRFDIDGPMTSYTLRRRGRGFWVLESSRMGFA